MTATNDNNDNNDKFENDPRGEAAPSEPTPEEPRTNSVFDNPDLTPEMRAKLETELRNYQEAVRQEFEEAVAKSDSVDAAYDNLLDYFKKNINMAGVQVIWLMEHSTSDGVRLNASKYVIECVRKGMVDDAKDPVSEILKGLQNASLTGN